MSSFSGGWRVRLNLARALEKAGWNIQDLDLIEANEAFAAQALAEMGSTEATIDLDNQLCRAANARARLGAS